MLHGLLTIGGTRFTLENIRSAIIHTYVNVNRRYLLIENSTGPSRNYQYEIHKLLIIIQVTIVGITS